MKKLLLIFIFCLSLFADDKSDALDILNSIRVKAGLNTLSSDDTRIINASQNHADYLKDVLKSYGIFMGHDESSTYSSSFYSGDTPTERGISAGYTTYVGYSENLSAGQSDINSSIDGLMSAIYHRFSFLSNEIDKIGIGLNYDTYVLNENTVTNNIYVYNMINSKMEELCSSAQTTATESYYPGLCVNDLNLKVLVSDYNNSKYFYTKDNPRKIIWPANGEQNFIPSFFEETPDPLPDYSVSGNPISVEFNEYYYKDITTYSFKLYDENMSELTDTRVIDKNSDTNGKFTNLQFALFPLKRLNFDTNYNVEFSYSAIQNDGSSETNTLTWSFKTKKAPGEIIKITQTGQTIEINRNSDYIIYFEPEDGADTIKTFASSYYTTITKRDVSFYDNNSLNLNLDGNVGDKFILYKTRNYIYSNPNENVDEGWHLLGATADINASILKGYEISWKYINGSWQAYSSKYDLTGLTTTFEQIDKYEGFWVKVPNDDINVTFVLK